jgi:uncharacterized protein
MDAIHIPQLLKTRNHSKAIDVDDFLPDLSTLTPVKGRIVVKHKGNYLEVMTKAEAIVTLTCDRCLQNYNHRLRTSASELIWLRSQSQQSSDDVVQEELHYEDLVETLPAQGYFHPKTWLYEQLCLQLPLQQLCNDDCPGIQLEDAYGAASSPESTVKPMDQRWASLEALRDRLSPQ